LPGTQEYAGYVLTAAARTVQEIRGQPFPADFPTDRDFRVFRVLAFQRGVAVIEQQFDRGRADRFTGTGAIENHIGDRVTTKAAGRALAHHPAYGINHVRFATAIRPDNANQAAREGNGGGIYK
jgi:hypothetical protein